ncbi:MAG: hypothetical protein ACYS8Z_10895 [Planctomycetota bacterium]|jgi:hypothetical protein
MYIGYVFSPAIDFSSVGQDAGWKERDTRWRDARDTGAFCMAKDVLHRDTRYDEGGGGLGGIAISKHSRRIGTGSERCGGNSRAEKKGISFALGKAAELLKLCRPQAALEASTLRFAKESTLS